MSAGPNPVADAFLSCLAKAKHVSEPYDHWLLSGALPDEDVAAISALPFNPPQALVFNGKRETNNSTRVFFNRQNQAQFEVCRRLVVGFNDRRVRDAIEKETGAALAGTHLRIEYCQDTEGFWLEPHTEILVKKFTMLVYLSDDPRLKDVGTDIHEGPPDFRYVCSAPYGRNLGLIFIPGANTWHAVGKRPLGGAIRKSIIVNYVTSGWRDTFELA
ncbi:MAG TPA: 2OG-Fe(II) oxygenase [Hyphomicrobiales bacterium]|nr:2OG-Fe(II) oxygenase [Hyphomicrobiales bacterium]